MLASQSLGRYSMSCVPQCYERGLVVPNMSADRRGIGAVRLEVPWRVQSGTCPWVSCPGCRLPRADAEGTAEQSVRWGKGVPACRHT